MQMNLKQQNRLADAEASRVEPLRTDRTVSGDDPEVAATAGTVEDPVVLGPDKARAANTNPMPARVLLISITLTAVAFLIGYLLMR